MQTTNDLLPVRIKELRKKAGLTQNQLGEKLGVSGKTVSAWEKGVRRPTFEAAGDLEKVLNTTLDYLIGGSDDPAPAAPPTDEDLARWVVEDELQELEENLPRICRIFGELDHHGKKAIEALLKSEYTRCKDQNTLNNYSGYSVSVQIKRSSRHVNDEE